jgi:hypothetical protein
MLWYIFVISLIVFFLVLYGLYKIIKAERKEVYRILSENIEKIRESLRAGMTNRQVVFEAKHRLERYSYSCAREHLPEDVLDRIDVLLNHLTGLYYYLGYGYRCADSGTEEAVNETLDQLEKLIKQKQ